MIGNDVKIGQQLPTEGESGGNLSLAGLPLVQGLPLGEGGATHSQNSSQEPND